MTINGDSLLDLANIACEAAVSGGAEFADVSVGYGRNLSVDIEASCIRSSDVNIGGGISIRAIYKGGTGWSSTDILSQESAAEAGANAARLSMLAEPDPDFITLPKPADKYPDISGLNDPNLASVDIKDIINYALKGIDEAETECSDAIVGGGYSASYHTRVFVNSLGISVASESSYIGGHIMVVIRRGEDVGSFYDFDAGRVLRDFRPDGIGAKAAQRALRFLGASKVQTGRMDLVLGPLASRSIFGSVAANADADDVQRNRSFMMGKLGEKIASDIVTVVDDPLIPRGLSSRPYSSEGTPSKPLTIVEDGVLKSYLYSSYSAAKAKTAETGHGTRGHGAVPSNVVPVLGNITSEEIIKNTTNGLYIDMGSIRPDSTTGDVSSSVDFGFKIENGELAYPVMSTMVGGSFLDMLKNIDAISSDYREEPGMIMPTVRIRDVQVAGSK